MNTKHKKIDTILSEERKFYPAEKFRKKAHISSMKEYLDLYKKSIDDPISFWESVAGELSWFKKWDEVLNETEAPFYKWFINGKTNISYNCLDRHLGSATCNKAAIIWEGEMGDQRTLTYSQLSREVNRFANALK
ncbi:MAG: acetyl-coenzyme A synthetase, partial [Omnitrophica bacterium]|nr:acetyl-coenzyme A synthetase [Candidatus Omnitrophota bacterium]